MSSSFHHYIHSKGFVLILFFLSIFSVFAVYVLYDVYDVSAAPPVYPVCGNSVVEISEQCDDGNANPGDGCSNTCQWELPSCTLVPSHFLVPIYGTIVNNSGEINYSPGADGIPQLFNYATYSGVISFSIFLSNGAVVGGYNYGTGYTGNMYNGNYTQTGIYYPVVNVVNPQNPAFTGNCTVSFPGITVLKIAKNNIRVNSTARCGDGDIDGSSSNSLYTTNFADNPVLFFNSSEQLVTSYQEFCDDDNLSDNDACTTICRPARCGDGHIYSGEEGVCSKFSTINYYDPSFDDSDWTGEFSYQSLAHNFFTTGITFTPMFTAFQYTGQIVYPMWTGAYTPSISVVNTLPVRYVEWTASGYNSQNINGGFMQVNNRWHTSSGQFDPSVMPSGGYIDRITIYPYRDGNNSDSTFRMHYFRNMSPGGVGWFNGSFVYAILKQQGTQEWNTYGTGGSDCAITGQGCTTSLSPGYDVNGGRIVLSKQDLIDNGFDVYNTGGLFTFGYALHTWQTAAGRVTDAFLVNVRYCTETTKQEQCDDGNVNNGDGCDSTCRLESPGCSITTNPSNGGSSPLGVAYLDSLIAGSQRLLYHHTAGSNNAPMLYTGSNPSFTYTRSGSYEPGMSVYNPYNTGLVYYCSAAPFNVQYTYCGDGLIGDGQGSGINSVGYVEQCDDGGLNGSGQRCDEYCQLATPTCTIAITGNGNWVLPVNTAIAYNYPAWATNTINYGDMTNGASLSHAYGSPGNYTITGTVSNSLSGSYTATCSAILTIPTYVCGDGLVGNGVGSGLNNAGLLEQCDLGGSNGNGISGCSASCQYTIPSCTLSATPSTGYVPLTTNIVGSTLSGSLFVSLSYGDGTTGLASNSSHLYTTGGTYLVSMVVRNPINTGITAQCITTVTGTMLVCGDGILGNGQGSGINSLGYLEQCDDGNFNNNDNCTTACRLVPSCTLLASPQVGDLPLNVYFTGILLNGAVFSGITYGDATFGSTLISSHIYSTENVFSPTMTVYNTLNPLLSAQCSVPVSTRSLYCGDGIVGNGQGSSLNSSGFAEQCDGGYSCDGMCRLIPSCVLSVVPSTGDNPLSVIYTVQNASGSTFSFIEYGDTYTGTNFSYTYTGIGLYQPVVHVYNTTYPQVQSTCQLSAGVEVYPTCALPFLYGGLWLPTIYSGFNGVLQLPLFNGGVYDYVDGLFHVVYIVHSGGFDVSYPFASGVIITGYNNTLVAGSVIGYAINTSGYMQSLSGYYDIDNNFYPNTLLSHMTGGIVSQDTGYLLLTGSALSTGTYSVEIQVWSNFNTSNKYLCFSDVASGSIIEPICGNNVLEYNEQCDLGTGNTLTCNPAYDQSCSYCDAATCTSKVLTGGYCGDGLVNGNEQCDGGSKCTNTCTQKSSGGGSGPKKDNCDGKDESPSYYDGKCEGEPKHFSPIIGKACKYNDEQYLNRGPFMDTLQHWSYGYMDTLRVSCIIRGRTSNDPGPWNGQPDGDITVAELLKIAVKILGIEFDDFVIKDEDVLYPTLTPFADISQEHWFAWYANYAFKKGLTDGLVTIKDGKQYINPDKPINRYQAIKIIMLTYNLIQKKTISTKSSAVLGDVVNASNPYYIYVTEAVRLGFVSGVRQNDGTYNFDGNRNLTRGEAAKIVMLPFNEQLLDIKNAVLSTQIYLMTIKALDSVQGDKIEFVQTLLLNMEKIPDYQFVKQYKVRKDLFIQEFRNALLPQLYEAASD